MTLQQIYYALTISRMGSMNKAAEALFISQPSLTSAIKELEREAGINIFLRTSKGVSETSEGAEFLMYARQVYQQYELLTQKYGDKGNIKRKFSVSTQHYSFAVKAFVETVKQFDTSKYEFAVRETKTYNVIHDVGIFKSEIGILYLSDFNRKIISKFLKENDLRFHHLIDCKAYVYIWKNHPLAKKASINLKDLEEYPCLSFEQGDNGSFYFAEEILSENIYKRTIKACDRATMLNLMIGLNGYTLCSGIICQELNGSDYIAVPFEDDEINQNSIMEIGYVTKRNSVLSEIGGFYIDEVKKYLGTV
ncbi:MAG: LysR family transcriptional regulator [Clostridia bacterium]|nr:LysR family transcriptional regulator [Clostridia bacterium]